MSRKPGKKRIKKNKNTKHKNLAHLISSYGSPFFVTFISFFVLSLGMIMFLVISAKERFSELLLVYLMMGIAWVISLSYMLYKKNLHEAVTVIFVPAIATVGLTSIIQHVYMLSNMEIYLTICLISYISGSGMAYLMHKITSSRTRFIKPAISASMTLAMLFSLNNVLMIVSRTLSDVPSKTADAGTGFLISMISFNFPFMMFYLKRHEHIRTLLYYIMPVATYIVLSILFVKAI